MPLQYNRPGVYLEENLLTGTGETGAASTVFLFVGTASKGRSTDPVRIESWTDYVNEFGGFDKVKVASATPGDPDVDRTTYLPYSVYSFYQNGGRVAYIQRAFDPSGSGEVATVPVTVGTGPSAVTAFAFSAKSAGVWGNNISVRTVTQEGSGETAVFAVQVMQDTGNGIVAVERFSNMSYNGEASVSGTKRIDEVINDPVYGSKYIQITDLPEAPVAPATSGAGNYADHTVDGTTPKAAFALTGGEDPTAPTSSQFESIARTAVEKIDGPVIFNVAGYLNASGAYVGSNEITTSLFDRGNVVYIDDKADPREAGTDSTAYAASVLGAGGLGSRYGQSTASSYVAAYTPWLIVPNPVSTGGTVTVPPAGSVMGVIARTDATRGVFRSPAGVDAVVSNAIGVDTKFTDSQLGDLNSRNVNVIRPVTGRGICVMGGRTRKSFGVDRYLSSRRTLVYLRETLSDATQFAVFENNDSSLWRRLEATAERILRPVWTSGGLAGDSAAAAYFIVCDETINTPASIAAGEVRMDIGVALQYPAEFVIIRLTQFEQGGSNVTIQQ